MIDYRDFLAKKMQLGPAAGFEPLWMPEGLHGFQDHLTCHSIRRGRSAIYADCVAGETIIRGPDGDERADVLAMLGRPVRVWSLNADREVVPAVATAPFVNGYAPLYRYAFASGRSIIASSRHRFLTPEGWRRGEDVAIGGWLAVSGVSPLRSIAGSGQSTPPGDDRRWSRTVRGCPGRCSACPCPCDGRLRPDSGVGRSSLPSRGDAPGRIRLWSCADGPESRSGCSHRRPRTCLPSMPRSGFPASNTAEAEGFRLPSFDPSPDLGSIRTARPIASATILRRPTVGLHPSAEQPSSACHVAACDLSFEWDTLVTIDYIRDDLFFDLHVPEFGNFLADDVWSHNCGLGKTPMQLTWAENVVRHTNRPVLLLAPIAVGAQTIREAAKWGVEAVRSTDGKFPGGARVVVANYERLHYFDPADFAGVVGDESSCLKDVDSKKKAAVTEFMRTIEYRLLCTATAAPNDFVELGTSAEILGELGYQDMLTRFFRQKDRKFLYKGWKLQSQKYELRGHAERDFWRWVCSWSRSCRKPSDLGFDDGPFMLPELIVRHHPIEPRNVKAGYLFDLAAATLHEQQEERRRTIPERCERVAELVAGRTDRSIIWCHLNDEGDLLERLMTGSVQVSGSDPEEAKEEAIGWFLSGGPDAKRVLISKPIMFGYGLNLQCCHHMTFFPSHSFEQWYQAVRRCWRFGQLHDVEVDVVTTPGGELVMANLQRKADQASAMFSELVKLMNESLRVERTAYGSIKEEIPAWL